ncbi:hypothetical protein LB507_001480 [Fusarium sp. FIESC RH6]|nr:hypothetical protein LB507_001480 [Fusarium sp. FIESC RH6]
MSEHTDDQIYNRLTYIALFESSTRNVHVSYRTLAENEDPEKLAADLSNAYKQHVKPFKRFIYRGVLMKKPKVSIVKLSGVIQYFILNSTIPSSNFLSQVANLPPASGSVHQLLIQKRVDDPTMTSAIRDPTVLRNVDREAFCQEYKAIFVEDGELVAQSALLIHHVNDPTASKVIGIAGSIFSVTLALLGAFVF